MTAETQIVIDDGDARLARWWGQGSWLIENAKVRVGQTFRLFRNLLQCVKDGRDPPLDNDGKRKQYLTHRFIKKVAAFVSPRPPPVCRGVGW